MIPTTKTKLNYCIYLETARASYPGGMSMYGKGIVLAGTKQRVSDFFTSKNFYVPNNQTFEGDHKKICLRLSKKIHLNPNRENLNNVIVAAKFVDTFLYQLMKFEEYRSLWSDLNLIIDQRIMPRLKGIADVNLLKILKNYPKNPYEATYDQYLQLQKELKQFITRLDSKFIRDRIQLNFLWASSK